MTADNSQIQPDYRQKNPVDGALARSVRVRWGGKFQYGDKVWISGISPELDGLYTVHDTMNKRHRHCLDILTNSSEKYDIFTKGVKIRRARVEKPTPAASQPASGIGRHAGHRAGSGRFAQSGLRGRARRPPHLPKSVWPNDYLTTAMGRCGTARGAALPPCSSAAPCEWPRS
ncbi:MAG: hypothetical protein WKG07_18500 [Hymenobacter sp.]